MARAHEALGDGWAQARLATDRLDALFEQPAVGGLSERVGHLLQELGKRVGLRL
jgi:hypothetical protein